ncbi:MAG: 30S ribosomal protein S12 methylthiotransferase RimO [Clostridiales bacterium]|nr:30S ribosomal protein S12 methylthiotransferase RimO [Clostridiales bacterium]
MIKNRIYIETLGCSKNLVDSEHMTGILLKNGYKTVDNSFEADYVIINTCAFINDSKKESIDTIFNIIEENKSEIIVAGCLAQRYAKELLEEIPEVKAYIGTSQFPHIHKVIERIKNGESGFMLTDDISLILPEMLPRQTLTPNYYAFVKIAEGCDNKCTFCIIPQLRGAFRSRKIDDIVKEVQLLSNQGVKEIILIAQDTTRFGIDIYGEYRLSDLLDQLNKIEGIQWIRIQYMYPDVIDENLILSIKRNTKVVPYFDIPVQHSSDKILKLMNRHTTKENIVNVLDKIRKHIPDAVIRTTLIIGFPGETDEDFNDLLMFIQKYPFNRLGAFKYSDEEDTPAYLLPNHVEESIVDERYEELMQVQLEISSQLMHKFIGKKMQVIIDEEVEGELIFIGRTQYDTPEVDGVVYVHAKQPLEIGEIYEVTISDNLEYDLIGEM